MMQKHSMVLFSIILYTDGRAGGLYVTKTFLCLLLILCVFTLFLLLSAGFYHYVRTNCHKGTNKVLELKWLSPSVTTTYVGHTVANEQQKSCLSFFLSASAGMC